MKDLAKFLKASTLIELIISNDDDIIIFAQFLLGIDIFRALLFRTSRHG